MASDMDTKEVETKAEDAEKPPGKEATPLTNPPLPSEESRSNLVDLAVKFLTNPRVAGSPMSQKRAFLQKKGLTDAEINQAVKLAGVSIPPQNNNQIVQAPPLPARTLSPVARTTWREYALIAAVVGGVGYALYQFIKNYVLPWFQQRSRQEERLADIQSSMEQLETNIRDVVTSVNDSTKALRDLLSEQQRHLQLLSSQVTALQTSMGGHIGSGVSIKEVKDEVSSLKGLLLNRHQFPPTPSRSNSQSSGIPQWQRAAQATPTKSNSGPGSEDSSSNSSPETAGKNGLVNGVESNGAVVNGRKGSKEETKDSD